MKLWQKNTDANQAVDRFTVGHDREMDLFLAEADVARVRSHIRACSTRSDCSATKTCRPCSAN